ncbi:beta-phosphoglucomutase [Dysgonomonas sp. PFB1-18]|uniref:HAD family hydrolase n=1 Tax=unclassified Dysgonomonas TaxID=2630389 RepID=UPI0024749C2B|nr:MULTISPECIES: HAD family phosphatase [unclassified Dysgonomonas]MDH6308502.1 beta-phosphoglucomutase [Dysgonomonas sp. PF1-14]MDH6338003.1 beta-phosphoglucomutase [Dysgonomonas sp. PF1-16]MDH6379500.1 beta-phosphoglucomutase [Dysgonomonas sp. PFB1-18]MDH6396831.1 beta-phosphoglucomutase [Dysgonomonas sp. PF1-23]
MLFSGVIFDFNGTLFWDTKLHNKAWDIFLTRHDLFLSDEDKFNKMHGKNNKDIFLSLFDESLTDTQIQKYILEKEGLYQELCLQTDMLMAPGAEEFLNYLKDHHIPFTIATASGKENLDFYFDHLPLSRWFEYDKVVYNNGKIKGKPDPQIYQIAMSVINKKPEEVIIFEDAVAGLQAARNADAGKIIVVDSNDDDYTDWSDCQIIKSFNEVDKSQLKY